MTLETQKNINNIQTQLKTIPTKKLSFPGGNKPVSIQQAINAFNKTYIPHTTCQLPIVH